MAWIEKRKSNDNAVRYRIRDRIDGKKVVVVENAGRWREIAMARLLQYEKDKASDRSELLPEKRLPIEEMCELNLKFHGPSLKGGTTVAWNTPYGNLKYKMDKIKGTWKGKYADEINKLMVRDFLVQFKTVGTKLRWLGTIGKMFRNLKDWQKTGNVLIGRYRLPEENPAYQWRQDMKPAEKMEVPDERVLSPEEWALFSKHLPKRAMDICEAALYRCLRLSDIKAISHLSIVDGHIKGLQAKTGLPFSVPVLEHHPKKYDFKNFNGDFERAQIKAGLHFPPNHPLHFSPKDLRRTGATWAWNQTRDLAAIQDLLGHRSVNTTRRYLRIKEVDIQNVVRAIHLVARSGATGHHPPLPTSLVPQKAHKIDPQK